MASLITSDISEFSGGLAAGGKLAGLDVGTRTIGLAICDAGWHFAGPVRTINRTKFTRDLEALPALPGPGRDRVMLANHRRANRFEVAGRDAMFPTVPAR